MPDHCPCTEVLVYQDRDDRWRARLRLSVSGKEQTTINVPSRTDPGIVSRFELFLQVELALRGLGLQ